MKSVFTLDPCRLQCRAAPLTRRVFLALLFSSALLLAQRGRRGGSGSVAPAPIKGVIVTFRGRLKQLSKKVILIEGDDKQLVTIRRNGKTKFWAAGKEVKAPDLDLESLVLIDAVEDNDLKFVAIDVKLDPAQKAPRLEPSEHLPCSAGVTLERDGQHAAS